MAHEKEYELRAVNGCIKLLSQKKYSNPFSRLNQMNLWMSKVRRALKSMPSRG